jgi:DNA-binding NarL/FixJ family response regulator
MIFVGSRRFVHHSIFDIVRATACSLRLMAANNCADRLPPIYYVAMKRTLVSAHREKDQSRTSMTDVLSAREREVMLLAAKGLANKEIARELKITEGTIKLHLHNIYWKLGIKSRFALAIRARNMRSGPGGGRDDPSDAV